MIIHALAVAGQLFTAAADTVPRFDPSALCRGAAQQGTLGLSLGLDPGVGPQQRYGECVRGETASRRRLVSQWSTFNPADRANCTGEATAGGLPSYTDLLTCLQMARDARKMGQ